MKTLLSVPRGDTRKWDVRVRDLRGAVLNLTGCTLRMAFYPTKPSIAVTTDGDAALVLSSPSGGITIVTAATGEVLVTISAAQSLALTSPSYVFDCQVTNGSGEIFTAASGTLTVSSQITHNS